MRSEPVLFTSSGAMEELVHELRLFLDLLDREYLSAGIREKKTHLSNILNRVLSEKEPSCKAEIPSGLPAPPQMPLPEIPHPWLAPNNGPPPLPSSSLPEGYYEEAVPLSPGKAPEYITSNYDSDAMSSSYESYDEEEEDDKGRKTRHQWPSEEASMDLVKDARICAFLLRKKRFGQWSKLLCVIKESKLLCYKSSKDQTPQMELSLPGCSVSHVPKDGKKKRHELKIVHQGADALVLAVQSKEQADEWLKVMREVCGNGTYELDRSGSPVHKPELEKKSSSDRPSSDGEATPENGHADNKDHGKGKKNSKSEQGKTGTVGKGAGKKITKIIGLGKKKASTEEQTSSAEEDVPTSGYLNVLSNNQWRERWCRLKDNQLLLHKDRDDLKSHVASLPLRGCEVSPGLDHKHPFAFRLLRNGQEVAVLEASSSEAMGRWIGVLLAETGSAADLADLHYDYIDVETTANVIQLAKQSLCFSSKRAVSSNPYLDNPGGSYACPSGTALHYHDVPVDGTFKGKKGSASNGLASKLKADPRSQQKKGGGAATNGTASLTRSNSNAEQCKYGKNRVEADAKRLQAKDDELTKRKLDIRNHLASLKKERKDLRDAIEASSGKRSQASLSERLKKVEDECRQKEEERVNLELELTEVKGSLKKALSGGVTLGLAIQPKAAPAAVQSPATLRRRQESSPFSSCDTSDAETCAGSLPVNSASLLRRQQRGGPKASPVRGHVLRKAKEWEQKSGT
ncbi:actin filament-associated protein 1 isoform X8 [Syngnathoides biaculeatus]|uniref:actin filament-associated protein 1 isoform X8 n=1 Tax=Syngnathoides biaculeatus TaxID=300417 RepID=UPI002ADE26C8|nr:actin filament-associated protein 1 isoform X8 [Syngnathoides biaculeatus]